MITLVILRGIQGSGKSTWAHGWVSEDVQHRARVNRDDIRAMAHSGYHGDVERRVIFLRDAIISDLLGRGVSVVVDDTNLPSRTVRELKALAKRHKAEVRIVDLTHIPLEVCIARDAARPNPVGGPTIRDYHDRYVRGKGSPLPVPELPWEPAPDLLHYYLADESKPQAYIVDIDGTVALRGDRSPFDMTRVVEDRPNWPVIRVLNDLYRTGNDLIFVSGRDDSCQRETWTWLVEHLDFEPIALHMRKHGDFRTDWIVKSEIFDNEIRNHYNILGVFDDRDQVVQMWRTLGLTCFQVAEGNF
ncbi:5'-hydroxyl kinase [Herbidospora galbida]|uniref:5'-hydroxyl kinase n=1 Tax=Herbidospora galbida TaxID=2575442 RepID=A0A4V5UYG2_9ACTN|nr:AAA family ATPase [Herbidospora galbida]TKK84663.1 5'-hydroxyl kinase [Herbidospora galbida]